MVKCFLRQVQIHASEWIHPNFETKDRHHQKFKTGIAEVVKKKKRKRKEKKMRSKFKKKKDFTDEGFFRKQQRKKSTHKHEKRYPILTFDFRWTKIRARRRLKMSSCFHPS